MREGCRRDFALTTPSPASCGRGSLGCQQMFNRTRVTGNGKHCCKMRYLYATVLENQNSFMNKKIAQLGQFTTGDYYAGPFFRRTFWYVISRIFFQSFFPWPSSLKATLLRRFGAKVGNHLVVKPHVLIKFPWFLEIGHNVWLGEHSWIDNLVLVRLGDNVCISQGAYLMTGNHDYTAENFAYRLGPIVIEQGAWVGAHAIVAPGVTLSSHSVLTAGSVAVRDTDPYFIYQGNPAKPLRARAIR